MKNFLKVFSATLVLLLFPWTAGDGIGVQAEQPEQSAITAVQDLSVSPDFGKVPLYFISNQGQVNEKTLYYAKTRSYTLWLTKEGLTFDSVRPAEEAGNSVGREGIPRYERDVSRIYFIGANDNMEVVATEKADYKVHYFIGNEKSKWKTDIPASEGVLYKEIYKNIDLKVYGIEREIEYDWVVRPGANVDDIRVEYKGVVGTKIDRDGNLVIETKFGELMHRKPVSYQEIGGKIVEVDIGFKRAGEDVYGFEPEEYNGNYILTIDPAVLVYSTYLGGNGADSCSGIAVDSAGYAYVTGITRSTDFPLQDAIDDSAGALATAFVTKFSVDGSSLEFSTYLGNSNYAAGADITLGGVVGIVVTGSVIGLGFPTVNAYQGTWGGGYDAFLTCLATNGSLINYSTYLGGSENDFANGISKVEQILVGIPPGPYLPRDNFHITGGTHSADFPLLSARDNSLGGDEDAFVAKWSAFIFPSSVALAYSTYLGGENTDIGYGIDQHDFCAYVTGTTFSNYFPQVKSTDALSGISDAFVTKFSVDGSTLEYSTFLGGSDHEDGFDIAVDGNGYAYVTGRTTSSDFPTNNAYDNSRGGVEDAFVTKVGLIWIESPPGHWLWQVYFPYSTYHGGSHYDRGWGIAVDSIGSIYVTGRTQSSNFPRRNPYDNSLGGIADAFISRLHQGAILEPRFSSYLGGSNEDKGLAIAVDGKKAMYIAGSTESSNFPTQNPFQGGKAAVEDAFVTKMTMLFDILATWSSGVWYRNSGTGSWVLMSSAASKVAAGDLDGDGTDDLIGVWSTGLWVKYSSSGTWARLSTTLPTDIACGDMNGDGRDDVLGTWTTGVWYRNSVSGSWVLMSSAASMVAAGDLDGDGTDDLIGVWSSGLWVKHSSTSGWLLIDSTLPTGIASGDMNGNGRDDVLGTWSTGVWYQNSLTSAWVMMSSSPAILVAAGDIDGDGTDDLIGTWSTGLWVKNSSTGGWRYIWGTPLPGDMDAGLFGSGMGGGAISYDAPIVGVNAEGPGNISSFEDLSGEGPGGGNFVYEEDENLMPTEIASMKMIRIPGPGEPGFQYIEQKNLVPQESSDKKRKNK